MSELAFRHELQRKALHLLFAAVPVAYAAGLSRTALAWILAAMLGVAVAVELGRLRIARVHALFARAVSHLLRDHEHAGWSGASWMLLAQLAGILLFARPVAIAALWAVAAGDAAAALVGRAVGRPRIVASGAARGGKTMAGSLACFLVTLAGALLLARLGGGAAAVGATAAALAERPSRPLDDNVRIVLATGAAISLWRFVLP